MEKITVDDDQEDTTIGSEGKMVIKLKIPKAAGGERSSMEGKRVCTECKKEFSSGKALGGHMRIHVQSAAAANRSNTFLKPSKTTKFKNQDFRRIKPSSGGKSNYRSSVNEQGKPTCSLCGKIFPSMKSLFGHMRCHPERLWRGILPPPNTPIAQVPTSSSPPSTSSLSENGLNQQGSNLLEDDDQVVDLTKFLRGWTVTERRGRRALRAPDEDEVLREAVEDLMSLAHGGPSSMADSDVTHKQLREVFEGSNSNKSPSNDKGKAVVVMEEEKPPVAKVELLDDGGGVNMIKNFSDNESDSRNTNEQMLISCKYKNPNKIKKRKKMKLMMELEEGFTAEMVAVSGGGGPQESKYKCTTCNKSFTSHQALGGHRSSHNKSKMTPNSQVEEDDYESFIMNQTSDNVEKEVEFAGGLHQCKICDKIFPTGQALGGHKRCHWTAAAIIEAQAPSSQVTSTGETASQTDGGGGRRRILDFDLNEVPPAAMMEEEAGNGVANGNGYASSSYNSNMG